MQRRLHRRDLPGSPDVVFADASLPGVDGYELAKRIKNNPQLAKIAVILLASQQTPYDDAKGKSAGVDDHVSKPFDTQALIDRTNQVIGRARSAPATAATEAKAAPAAVAAAGARPAPPPPQPAAAARPAGGTRMGIGGPVPLQPAAPSKPPQPVPAPAMRPAAAPPLAPAAVKTAQPPTPVARPAATAPAAAVQVATQDLGTKLAQLGLTREQVEGVLALSREVIEQVVWEVVPDLAETLIKEEIRRLTAE